jgi:hypothetical protein
MKIEMCGECNCNEDIPGSTLDQDIAETLAGAYAEADCPQDAITALAGALKLACKELGWIKTAGVAHDVWFEN